MTEFQEVARHGVGSVSHPSTPGVFTGKGMAEDAFEVVVGRHHLEIHRYVARVTRRGSDADDLSQETFLRAFRAYRSLGPEANVRAWLFAIATNVCRNHFRAEARRRRAHEAAGAEARADGGGRPDGETAMKEASARIDQIVAGLPMKQRLAFTMRKMHELDYDAIGASLGCSAESARANVFQALRKIRRGLDGPAAARVEADA
jgi:RNA polymerase sigma-70 factor (ECF subfamily)